MNKKIMFSQISDVGDTVQLTFHSVSDGFSHYNCRITSNITITKKGTELLEVTVLGINGRPLNIRKDQAFIGKCSKDKGLFFLSGSLAARREESPYLDFVIEINEVNKLQRRKEERLKTWLPAKMIYAGCEKDISGFIRDISANGMQLITKDIFQLGSEMMVFFPHLLDGKNKKMHVTVKVVRLATEMEIKRDSRTHIFYGHGAEFINLSEENSEAIIKYVFAQNNTQ